MENTFNAEEEVLAPVFAATEGDLHDTMQDEEAEDAEELTDDTEEELTEGAELDEEAEEATDETEEA